MTVKKGIIYFYKILKYSDKLKNNMFLNETKTVLLTVSSSRLEKTKEYIVTCSMMPIEEMENLGEEEWRK